MALSHPDASGWEATAVDVLSENQRMERLVNDLLFLARNEERPAGLTERHPARPRRHRAVRGGAGSAPGAGCRVDISRVSGGRVRGVGDHLTRVVRNLVENAERHAAGAVTLELRRISTYGRAPQIELVVSDDGPGVAAGVPGAHLRPLHPPRRRPQPARR